MSETRYQIYYLEIAGHYYVGCTKNFEERVKGHYYHLKNGYHPNKQLQTLFNTHGGFNSGFIACCVPGLSQTEARRLEEEISVDWQRCVPLVNGFLGDTPTSEVREKSRTTRLTPEFASKHSKKIKETWTDPGVNHKRIEGIKRAMSTPEYSAKKSEQTKRLWADPEFRQQRTEALREINARPDVRRKQAETRKKTFATEEYSRKRSEIAKRLWADPEYRERMLQKRAEARRLKNASSTTSTECR